jgi:hypothetical protein
LEQRGLPATRDSLVSALTKVIAPSGPVVRVAPNILRQQGPGDPVQGVERDPLAQRREASQATSHPRCSGRSRARKRPARKPPGAPPYKWGAPWTTPSMGDCGDGKPRRDSFRLRNKSRTRCRWVGARTRNPWWVAANRRGRNERSQSPRQGILERDVRSKLQRKAPSWGPFISGTALDCTLPIAVASLGRT